VTAPATTAAAVAGGTQLGMATTARTVQLAIRAQLMRDVTRLWPALDAKRLDETFPGWIRAMILLVTGYHGQSAQAAAAFYRQARADATQSPAPGSVIRLAQKPAEEWLTRAFGYAGPGMLSRDTARPGTALSTTLGTASRIALDGGRSTVLNTVQHDPVAVGWYRVTDGQPCAFCALLAARGVVYKKDTAGFQAHNDCGCSGAPAFSHGQQLPEISRVAAQVYTERGSGDALAAFRKAWAEHQARTA
jgi:hypothetical protein